jgi:hypothetical protein
MQWPHGRSSCGAVPSATPVIGTHLTGHSAGMAPLRTMCLVARMIIGASSFALPRCPDSFQQWLCERVQRKAKLVPDRARKRAELIQMRDACPRSLSQLPSSLRRGGELADSGAHERIVAMCGSARIRVWPARTSASAAGSTGVTSAASTRANAAATAPAWLPVPAAPCTATKPQSAASWLSAK